MVGSADSPASGRSPLLSNLGSERVKDMRLEGVPFHALTQKGVSRHSNSDFSYAGNDEFHSVKIYRGLSGGDLPKIPNNDETFYGSKALLKSSSLPQARLPHPTHTNTNEYPAIWDLAVTMNVPGNVQHPSHIAPFMRQSRPVTFRDGAAGPSVISHAAADEGLRDRENESGVRNLMKSSTMTVKSNPKCGGHVLEAFGAEGNFKTGAYLPESESPIPKWTRSSSSSSSRQMTIFYDGHAYVFDNVHPNKAEVIMAMAGSNAITCSSLSAKSRSSMSQVKEGSTPTVNIDIGTASDPDQAGIAQGKSYADANTFIHEFRSSDQIAGTGHDSKGIR